MRARAPSPVQPVGGLAAGAFLLVAGCSAVSGRLPPGIAQASAYGALLAAAAALFAGGGRAAILVAAALLGAARTPAALPIASPSRPVALSGRLLDWQAAERGWTGTLDRLRDPAGRPLDTPERTLELSTFLPGPPAAGARLRVAGLLAPAGSRLRLEKADWFVVRAEADRADPIAKLRGWTRRRLHATLPPAEAGLAQALILGERNAVPQERYAAYRRLGLLHLLAVSGLHVWLWDALLRRILRGPLALLRLPCLTLAGVLAGGRPPVVRALCAVLLRDVMARRGRRVGGAALWWAALCVELALLPPREADAGLVLSYSATFALIGAAPGSGAGWLRRALQPSAAAFLGTAPWLHAWQGTLEPWSIPLTPLLALLLPLRMTGSLLACLPGVGPLSATLVSALGAAEGAALATLNGLPASPLALPQVATGTVAASSFAAWLLLRARRGRRTLALALAAACVGLGLQLARPARPGILALPVGHGLALVVAGEEESLLFDLGSGDLSARAVVDRVLLPALAARGWPLPRDLAASHADSDHVNAMPLYERRWSCRTWKAPPGEAVSLPGFQPFTLTLLGCRSGGAASSNARGQILEVRWPQGRAILLGDPFGFSLRELARRLDPGPVDLVLAPHHGLTTDGLPELLDRLQPREVWISCGARDLPLPAAALFARRELRVRTTLAGPLDLPCGDP